MSDVAPANLPQLRYLQRRDRSSVTVEGDYLYFKSLPIFIYMHDSADIPMFEPFLW